MSSNLDKSLRFYKCILVDNSIIYFLISTNYWWGVRSSKLLSINWIALAISATYLTSASVALLFPNSIFSLMLILKRIGSCIT